MQKQYAQLKMEAGQALLLFRLGDFYELFGDDAVEAAPLLEVALTSREMTPGTRTPMCGVPHHALTTYLARLLAAGRSVAIADQMEDPSEAQGLVRREIVQIITPGTVTDPELLDRLGERPLAAIAPSDDTWGLATADVSTGRVRVALLDPGDGERQMWDELSRIGPAEVLLERGRPELLDRLQTSGITATELDRGEFESGLCTALRNTSTLDAGARRALDGLLSYLARTARTEVQLHRVETYRPSAFMGLDPVAQRNLELTVRSDGGSGSGTLFSVMDRTVTPMGRRQLKTWLLHPLLDVDAILRRQAAVRELAAAPLFREGLRRALRRVYDLQRLANRVRCERATPRELWVLGLSLRALPEAQRVLSACGAPLLVELSQDLDPMEDVAAQLEQALQEDAPAAQGQGGIFRPGFDSELDRLRTASAEGRAWIADLERRERERTGIRSLKVGFHRVFGYYLEISAANLGSVPEDYQRRQTLAGGERFVTPELKELEQRILGAEERSLRREWELFSDMRRQLVGRSEALERTADAIAALDAIASLADVASRGGWICPICDDGVDLVIRDGRHPVLEQLLGPGRFVPNDVELQGRSRRFLLITGPNMAGKSTYMRQVALITILAQIGSFVPASAARVGICDRIFTRIGASDDLAGGRSTFMVEMMEVATLLVQATRRSLLLLDEIGRGTGTLDGLSIAWAVSEDVTRRLGARTLFATHYHELTTVVPTLPGACNLHAVVAEESDRVVFLHRVAEGASARSYGVAVAALAGVPPEVCDRARELLQHLEEGGGLHVGVAATLERFGRKEARTEELPAAPSAALEVARRLAALDPLRLTPIQALDLLFALHADAQAAVALPPE